MHTIVHPFHLCYGWDYRYSTPSGHFRGVCKISQVSSHDFLSCYSHDTGENASCPPVVNADISSLRAVTTLSALPWDLTVLVRVLFRYGLNDCCLPVSDIPSRRCPRLMLVTCTGNLVTPDLHWLVIDIPWHAVHSVQLPDSLGIIQFLFNCRIYKHQIKALRKVP